MTLTFELDLDILPLDLHAEIQVCTSVRSAVRARHTHRQNDDAKTITPVADAGCKKHDLFNHKIDWGCPKFIFGVEIKTETFDVK